MAIEDIFSNSIFYEALQNHQVSPARGFHRLMCARLGNKSTITKKPVVIDNQIVIREIMNMTVLFDHDVIDGANMARFISDLSGNIEKGMGL